MSFYLKISDSLLIFYNKLEDIQDYSDILQLDKPLKLITLELTVK